MYIYSPSFHDPKDNGPPGSSVHGILQATILEWVVIPFSRGSLTQGSNLHFLCLLHCRWILYHCTTWEAPYWWLKVKSKVLVAQSYLTLCIPMDCSLPGSSVHEIFQVIILEWVAIPFSRASSPPRSLTIWATREDHTGGWGIAFLPKHFKTFFCVSVIYCCIWICLKALVV